MPTDKDIEKALRDAGKEKADYPPDLQAATRAEFTTLVRTSKKKGPGCPLFASSVLLLIAVTVFLVAGYSIGSMIIRISEFFMWMFSMSA